MHSDPAAATSAPCLLSLYVAGATRRSVAAIQDLQRFCEAHLTGRYTLEIIDVYQQPARARADGIVATPTLVKHEPAPARRLVGGDFAEPRVLSALGVSSIDR
jgi:circadian clock protein KaiB